MESLEDCLSLQQSEMEMLQSMYPTEEELHIDDPYVWRYHQKVMEDIDNDEVKKQGCLKLWSFTLTMTITPGAQVDPQPSKVCIRVTLPLHYPVEKAHVFLSSQDLSRDNQSNFNRALLSFIESEIPSSEQMLLPIVDWVRDNAGEYLLLSRQKQEDVDRKPDDRAKANDELSFCVMWLYMHHIYNKEKRRNILQWAQDLRLCGFSLPGKPGVVYVEGAPDDVNDYFIRLRRLSWQKMSCKQKEIFKVKSLDDVKKFDCFQEIAFDVHGSHGYHMDMGQFRDYLSRHGLEYIFNELFGMKDKSDQ